MGKKSNAAPESRQSADHMLVLERGLAVIESFDGHSALSVSEVAKLTGISRPSARRCLLTLENLGYATFDGRVFCLSPRVLRLGFSYFSGADLPKILQPALERVSNAISESCSASVLDGCDVLYVARVATKRIISVDLQVGSRIPAYCSAMGRVLLASLPKDRAVEILRKSDRTQRTKSTVASLSRLSTELNRVREQDYSIVSGELEAGLVTIAVPVRNSKGETVAAVNVSSQIERSTPKYLVGHVLPLLRDLQSEVASLLR